MNKYSTILGIITPNHFLDSDVDVQFANSCIKKLEYVVEARPTGVCFSILNGVTGYESCFLEDLKKRRTKDRWSGLGWCACVGTSGRWNRLWIPFKELMRVPQIKEMMEG